MSLLRNGVWAAAAFAWSTQTLCAASTINADAPGTIADTRVFELATAPQLAAIVPRLAAKRVVYIGEVHDRLEHHLVQLEIIRRLHQAGGELAIGVGFFERRFQPVLDLYIAGKLDVRELLARTEFYSRWGYDFRLYAPILEYAREHRIAVLALNAARELTRAVGSGGLAALDAEQRAQLPAEIDRSDDAYRERLRAVYAEHPAREGLSFENFVEVQLLWDEAMAERAADHLRAHPGRRLVVLAGNGHLAFGAGIPRRVARRLPVTSAIVLNAPRESHAPGVADYLVFPPPRELPPAGMLGVVLEPHQQAVRVAQFVTDSAAEAAGVRRGDELVTLDGASVGTVAEVRAALWDKRPGDRVTLDVRRRGRLRSEELRIEVALRAASIAPAPHGR